MPYPPPHNPIGLPFIELQTVDSTNNYALGRVRDGLAEHGLAIFAHEQTAGKGQRGKNWSSPKGENIALSIVMRPFPLTVAHQFRLSACIATAALRFFQKYAGSDSTIKWPNDLYWKDRKAGGILIENVVGSREPGNRKQETGAGNWLWAVAGIGVNINQTSFSPELPNPVSLKQITGQNFNPAELAKELCACIHDQYEILLSNDFEKLYNQYLSSLYKRQEKVKLKKGNRAFEAFVKGVSSSGKLIVQHGIEEEFDFGEVEWLLEKNGE